MIQVKRMNRVTVFDIMMKINDNAAVFIDTNVALHFKRIDQIDWRHEVAEKNCDIIICSVFLAELEKHKTEHPNKKIRKRAGEYSAWLAKKYDEPLVREGVRLRFLPNEPMIDYRSHRLDPTNFDDRLIAAVIELTEQETDRHCYVMTADLGLTLKLKSRDLATIKPAEKYELPKELDSEEKEIRDLRAQVFKLTNRIPSLDLHFKSQDRTETIRRQRLVPKDELIERTMDSVRSKHPYMKTPELDRHLTSPTTSQAILQIGQTMRGWAVTRDQTYNSQLDSYFSEYRDYLDQYYTYALHRAAIAKVELTLSNLAGSAPANNVEVYLRCDKPALFITEEEVPRAPKAPSPPEKPGIFGGVRPRLEVPDFVAPRTLADVLRDADKTRPRLVTTGENAKFYLHQVKHRQDHHLLPLFIDFSRLAETKYITIAFEIHASELVDPVDGTLRLQIESS